MNTKKMAEDLANSFAFCCNNKDSIKCAEIAIKFIIDDIIKQRESVGVSVATTLLILQTNRYKSIEKQLKYL